MHIERDRELQTAKRVVGGAMAIFVITTVHHVYGAWLYHTLWRVHAAVVSGLATAMIIASHWLFRKYRDAVIGTIAVWVFIAVTFLVPFFGFGLFEGVYNHGLKDALYFAHASPGLMGKLFPAPAYEMPNDSFFEVTGLMHILAGLVVGYYLFRFVGLCWRRRRRVVEFEAMLAILANDVKTR